MARKNIIKTFIMIGIAITALTGCSDNGPTAVTDSIDTAPPAVPTGVTATMGADGVTLAWTPNTVDIDLAGYMVDRQNTGQTTQLTTTPITTATYADQNPVIGTNTYRIYAVDQSGNESAVVCTVVVVTGAHPIADPHLHN